MGGIAPGQTPPWETDFYLVWVLGRNCARLMRVPDPSPVLDKGRAPMGPEILSSTGGGVWRNAPMALPDSSSVLDKLQSATPDHIWIFEFIFEYADLNL